ncbi:MAG TPA: rhomboid family intramembrane serine protease [Terriglobia bacterium]
MIQEDHLQFLQALWARRTPYTYFFFGFNIFIFILMAFAGGSTNEPTLMAFGVKSNPEIAIGQWWRFVTPIFLHIGLLHIGFNSYALWVVGPQVEKLYGGARFVILYVLTGIAGVAGSYLMHPETQSAGASGAIFGLFGVLLVFGIRHRHEIPPFFKRAVGTGVLPVILINLVIGFSIPAIDNSAHIGGLLAGAALASVIRFQRPGEEESPLFTSIQMAVMGLIAVSFFAVWKNYNGPHLSVRNVGRGFTQILTTGSTTEEFINAINNAQKTFEETTNELQEGHLDRLPALKTATAKSIDELRKSPSLAATADQLTADLLKVMQDQYAVLEDVQRAGTVTFSDGRRLKENAGQYAAVMARFSAWVQKEGPRYGIQMGRDR